MLKILEVKELYCGYPSGFSVGPISLEMKKGEVLLVLGPNGAGKTTFLKTLLGLLKPLSGEVKLLSKEVGYVPQREYPPEFPLTVFEYIYLPLSLKEPELPYQMRRDKVFELLSVVGLRDRYKERVVRLSGGQFRKLTIARSLVGDPSLILLDEPLTFLDIASQKEIVDILSLLKRRGVAQIVVTHDINPLTNLGDKALFVGKSVIFGSIGEVLNEELLEQVYGEKVLVLEYKGRKCLIHPDHHRPHGGFSSSGERSASG